jgi:hypothetical protein
MRSHLDSGRGATSIRLRHRGFAVIVIAAACGFGATRGNGQTPPVSAGGPADPATPRTQAGHPDLSGNWARTTIAYGEGPLGAAKTEADGKSICVRACPGSEKIGGDGGPTAGDGEPRVVPTRPKYRPEFQAKVKALDERQIYEDPALHCLPPGVPRIGPPPRILQTAHEVVFLYDDVSGNFFRMVPTDGRPRRTDTDPSYLGDAVGHWEGDTLVVETTNFNADSWLIDDGAFHTDKLRVVERVRRVGDTLEYQATAYDPDVLAEPFVVTRRLQRSTPEIAEAPPCIERDVNRAVDLSHHGNRR